MGEASKGKARLRGLSWAGVGREVRFQAPVSRRGHMVARWSVYHKMLKSCGQSASGARLGTARGQHPIQHGVGELARESAEEPGPQRAPRPIPARLDGDLRLGSGEVDCVVERAQLIGEPDLDCSPAGEDLAGRQLPQPRLVDPPAALDAFQEELEVFVDERLLLGQLALGGSPPETAQVLELAPRSY